MEEKRQQFLFRAVDQVMVDNIVEPIEEDSKKGFWKWGLNNDYPQYLDGLYKEVATLRSIIEGTIDFVVGDKIEIDVRNMMMDTASIMADRHDNSSPTSLSPCPKA